MHSEQSNFAPGPLVTARETESDAMMKGTLLWFNEINDIGVIVAKDGAQISVPGPGFANGLRPQGRCRGTAVEFVLSELGGLRTATDVNVLPDPNPRRARQRRPSSYRG
jgi:hypothetical protein